MNKVIDKGFKSCRFVSTIVKHAVHGYTKLQVECKFSKAPVYVEIRWVIKFANALQPLANSIIDLLQRRANNSSIQFLKYPQSPQDGREEVKSAKIVLYHMSTLQTKSSLIIKGLVHSAPCAGNNGSKKCFLLRLRLCFL